MGTLIDDQLNWGHHIASIKSKLNSANFALAQVKNFLPIHARKAIYESLGKSHLNFSNIIYGASKQILLNGLQSSQNKLIRNLANKKYNSHADPIYKDLGQAKVTDLIKMNRITLVRKFKLGLTPSSLEPLFTYKSNTDEMRIRNDDGNFATKDNGSYKIGLFPMNETLKSWNALPTHLKNIPKLKSLKSALLEHYISLYDTECLEANCYPCQQNT